MIKKLQSGSDIRGIASNINNNLIELTNDITEKIMQGFAIWLSNTSNLNFRDISIAVGHDSRNSAMRIKNVVINTLRNMGITVYDCSLASTPAMYMAISILQCTASIEITASHLHGDKNGFKFFTSSGSLSSDNITEILNIANNPEVLLKNNYVGTVREINLMSYYCEKLRNLIKNEINSKENFEKPLKNLKVVVDASNGVGGFFVREILDILGADTTGSVCLEPDGNFPVHEPNPEDPEAMNYIANITKKAGADLGIIFDTDVDRVMIVDSDGEKITHNKFIALVSAIILEQNPNSIIVTDSVTSESLKNFIKTLGGHQFRYKRGYNNVISMAKKINNKNNSCPLAIETSGHVAFRENNFIDDGAYLACKILIKIMLLKKEQKKLHDLITNYKSPVNEINMRFDISSNNNIEKVFNDLEILAKSGKNIELDSENVEGTRVYFPAKHQNGWLLLRKSLHDDKLILYAESYVPNGLKSILDFTKQFLKKYDFININF